MVNFINRKINYKFSLAKFTEKNNTLMNKIMLTKYALFNLYNFISVNEYMKNIDEIGYNNNVHILPTAMA